MRKTFKEGFFLSTTFGSGFLNAVLVINIIWHKDVINSASISPTHHMITDIFGTHIAKVQYILVLEV